MPIPPKPPALQVTTVTHHSLELTWESLHAKLSGVLSAEDGKLKAEVQVKRLDQQSDDPASWDAVYKGYDTKCSVTGLADSQSYYLRFRFGVNSGWGEFSNPQAVKTARRLYTGEDLHRLVRLDKLQELQRVLNTGEANPNAPDDKGFSPLMQAALAGKGEFCEMLFNQGAEVDWCGENGKTALMLVSYRGVLPSIRQLLDRGASRRRRDRKGSTALHYAVDGEKLEALSLLLTYCRENPVLALEETSDNEAQKYEIETEDVTASELLSARDTSGCCAIIRCAMLKNNGNPDVAKALLNAGASADAADDQGQTALFYCAMHRHLRMAELLLNAGADPARPNIKGVTPTAVADAQESAAMRSLLARRAAAAAADAASG